MRATVVRRLVSVPALLLAATIEAERWWRPPPAAPAAPAPDAGPVVLVGGFCTTDPVLRPLRDRLHAAGHTVHVHTVDAGMGCAARSVGALADRIEAAAEIGGGPVRLVGYSRGGQFARVALHRVRDRVRSLTTLGTPFDIWGLELPVLLSVAAVTAAGSLGVPGLATLECLAGRCCAEFREQLRAPVDLPFTAIVGRADRLVSRAACTDPSARTVEVDTGHLGLLDAPPAQRALACALAT